MISVYQPPKGHNSTTVMFGRMPKNVSVSSGWRYSSRALFAAERCPPSTIALSFARSAPEVGAAEVAEVAAGSAAAAVARVSASRHVAIPRTRIRLIGNLPLATGGSLLQRHRRKGRNPWLVYW